MGPKGELVVRSAGRIARAVAVWAGALCLSVGVAAPIALALVYGTEGDRALLLAWAAIALVTACVTRPLIEIAVCPWSPRTQRFGLACGIYVIVRGALFEPSHDVFYGHWAEWDDWLMELMLLGSGAGAIALVGVALRWATKHQWLTAVTKRARCAAWIFASVPTAIGALLMTPWLPDGTQDVHFDWEQVEAWHIDVWRQRGRTLHGAVDLIRTAELSGHDDRLEVARMVLNDASRVQLENLFMRSTGGGRCYALAALRRRFGLLGTLPHFAIAFRDRRRVINSAGCLGWDHTPRYCAFNNLDGFMFRDQLQSTVTPEPPMTTPSTRSATPKP